MIRFTSHRHRRFAAGLVVAACLLFAMAAAPAQDDAIVVTGSREAAPRQQIAADVVVIDAERIRHSAADSLEDLLRREAGLQLTRSGAPGQNAGVFIRGASSGQTLLLVDGVRVGAASLGTPEFDLLSLASIERIEVLRGPASSLYGADAIGGVVQVFTRRGEGAPRASLRLGVGGYGAREAAIAGDARQGDFDLAAGASHESLEGVSAVRPGDAFGNYNPDRDGFERHAAWARVGVEPAPGQRLGLVLRESRLDAQYDGSEFLPPAFAQDSTPDFRNRARTRVVALDGRAALGSAWQLSAQVAGEDVDRRSGASAPDRFRTERRQVSVQASWRAVPGQQLTLAVERLREDVQSSSYAGDVGRTNDAIVLAYAGAAGALQVQAEARQDRNSAYGRTGTGRLGVRWPVGTAFSVRALVGDSFRAPSFNDLYYPGYGVSTLRPEHGRSAEIGFELRERSALGAAEASLTVYRQDLRDLIAYESDRAFCPSDPAYDFGCARNLQRARLQGATLAATLDARAAGQGWWLRGTLDLLDAEDGLTGARLQRRAAQQHTLSLHWRAGELDAGAEWLRVGTRPDGGVWLPAESTLALQAGWRFAAGWQLQAKLLNATDEDLQPARDYQGLGRQAWLVLRWEGAW